MLRRCPDRWMVLAGSQCPPPNKMCARRGDQGSPSPSIPGPHRSPEQGDHLRTQGLCREAQVALSWHRLKLSPGTSTTPSSALQPEPGAWGGVGRPRA